MPAKHDSAKLPETISGGIALTWYDKIFKPKTVTLANGKTVTHRASRGPVVAVLIIIVSIISVQVTGFDMTVLAENGGRFWDILFSMFPPNWDYMPSVWQPLFDTIKMSLLGSFIGSVLVIPFAVAASTNIVHSKVVVALMRLLLSIIRTLPTIVTALIATYIFGLGTLAGTTAIAIFTFAYVGKILYEEIETVDMGAFEAMEAIGAGKVRAFTCAIVPQILPSYLSNCLFCFEGNVRYASILGYVGAGGLGLVLNEGIAWRMYPEVGMVLVALFVTVFIIESISRALRRRLA
ncbi:MAG: phosphonate ABC transporter, permease protein PhnE [Atopobiaceae bacterium]